MGRGERYALPLLPSSSSSVVLRSDALLWCISDQHEKGSATVPTSTWPHERAAHYRTRNQFQFRHPPVAHTRLSLSFFLSILFQPYSCLPIYYGYTKMHPSCGRSACEQLPSYFSYLFLNPFSNTLVLPVGKDQFSFPLCSQSTFIFYYHYFDWLLFFFAQFSEFDGKNVYFKVINYHARILVAKNVKSLLGISFGNE